MTWHYGIVKHETKEAGVWFGLHEIYTDPDSHTVDPVGFTGDTREEVIEALEMALRDAKKWPVKIEDNLDADTIVTIDDQLKTLELCDDVINDEREPWSTK